MSRRTIAIFDIGKTNKKIFLFDEDYQLVYEKSEILTEIADEDGDPCEDLEKLTDWILTTFDHLTSKSEFDISAINFAAYGASLVLIDDAGRALSPLYNYLKKYPDELKRAFYHQHGQEEVLSACTASPALGNLNSGMQLYRIKKQKPDLFRKIKFALHLPQYACYLLTGKACSDITSIGCHTALWDFSRNRYHDWVAKEGIDNKLAPVVSSDTICTQSVNGKNYKIGVGLHDSSAALIPYLLNFTEPFALLSTGTWCITLNPFNNSPLTADELLRDCLCYLQYNGKQVKASRFFAGHFHDEEVARIARYFSIEKNFCKSVVFSATALANIDRWNSPMSNRPAATTCVFSQREIKDFTTPEDAYHQLMYDLTRQQFISSRLVVDTNVTRLFVDGGFSNNTLFMNLLAFFFPDIEVYAASMPQATALGAALVIHSSWNSKPLPKDLIDLKYYSAATEHQL